MTTSLIARESTLPPPKLPTSNDLRSIIEQFISDDELRRQLDVEPAIVTISHSHHTYPAMGDLGIMAAASSARKSQTYPDLIIHQAKPQPRSVTHVLAETHTTNNSFFEFIRKQDSISPIFWIIKADTQPPEYLAAPIEFHGAKENPVVREFAAGIDGIQPDQDIVAKAARLVKAATERATIPDIAVDIDGALSFDLRLRNGLLLMAELSIDGILDASVYNDAAKKRIHRLPRATEAQFIDLLQ